MNRTSRKTVTVADLIAALKLHPCPEVMQFFHEELQPAPPPAPPKAKSKGAKEEKKRGPKPKRPPAAAADAARDESESAPPPAKRPRARHGAQPCRTGCAAGSRERLA